MNFRDCGIIIEKKTLKENLSIITLFTKNHGLYSGALREGRKKAGDSLVPGNLVDFFWSARLHEHLGNAKCELIKSYNHLIVNSRTKLYAFNSIVSLIKMAFHEREPHNDFFPQLTGFLDKSAKDFIFTDYIKLELAILAETGHALQLDSCIAGGGREDLCYVSPKSGCAVSKKMGEPFASKLLILPEFMTRLINDDTGPVPAPQKKQALDLTFYFLSRYILSGTTKLEARNIFAEHALSLET